MSAQSLFMKVAADMKRALKRKADESDSEDSIDQVTNRGNKLKKKARYVREGQLADPNGPQVYKERITFTNKRMEIFEREIISRRPPLYDEDGFQLDSEEEDDEIAIEEASEFYPYSDIRIEDLLAPLLAAADLPDHPTLSRPFTSKTLTELTGHASDMMQKEKKSLWRMKQLLTRLSGDHTWIPCEMLETPEDVHLFADERNGYREHLIEKERLHIEGPVEYTDTGDEKVDTGHIADIALTEAAKEATVDATLEVAVIEGDVPMVEAANERSDEADTLLEVPSTVEVTVEIATNLEVGTSGETEALTTAEEAIGAEKDAEDLGEAVEEGTTIDPESETTALVRRNSSIDAPPNPSDPSLQLDGDPVPEDVDEIPAPHRMRTRAQAQAASDDSNPLQTRSMTPSSNESYIHPLFLAPLTSFPDRDFGLPSDEASETRRLLQLYVQKQEEICRGTQRIYEGLLKAERLRKTVLKWAKAEGHVGEMSDGEDWYDMEEWGLTEELKKGQDEEEEDVGNTSKKTRTRRQ